jgi:hypothetical protein
MQVVEEMKAHQKQVNILKEEEEEAYHEEQSSTNWHPQCQEVSNPNN